MKKRSLPKLFAIILLCSIGYSFAHLMHMGMMPSTEECPHAQDSHELCKVVLNAQTTDKTVQKEILAFFLVVIPILFVALPLVVRYIQKVSKATENDSPPLMQQLFSRGILNPKAP